jgi:hypothetical protein
VSSLNGERRRVGWEPIFSSEAEHIVEGQDR